VRLLRETAPAATMDHVFAREFFLPDRRANLPKVPACAACNGAKSQLEHYLTAVLPFGGQHADGWAHLSGIVPRRLARNQKLARQLSAGLSSVIVQGRETPAITIPIDPEKVGEPFALIAKGLVWHHWQVLLPPAAFGVRAEMLSAAGEQLYNQALAMNSGARVRETPGNGTFSYEGVQSAENPELSVWRFSAFGGLTLSGDPEAPGEISSQIGAMTGSHALLAKLKAIEAPERSAGAPSDRRREFPTC
jgi:hypothetical protein